MPTSSNEIGSCPWTICWSAGPVTIPTLAAPRSITITLNVVHVVPSLLKLTMPTTQWWREFLKKVRLRDRKRKRDSADVAITDEEKQFLDYLIDTAIKLCTTS